MDSSIVALQRWTSGTSTVADTVGQLTHGYNVQSGLCDNAHCSDLYLVSLAAVANSGSAANDEWRYSVSKQAL